MILTVPQLQAIKSWVQTNNQSLFDQSSVNLLNADAAPDYFIFKDNFNLYEALSNGFDWTIVDNESVGQARIIDRMLKMSEVMGGVDAWKLTVLKGIGEAYKGNTPAGKEDHRRNILRNHFPRKCRVWERLFVIAIADWNVGANNDKTGVRGTNTNPDIMPLDSTGKYLEGPITLDIVVASEST